MRLSLGGKIIGSFAVIVFLALSFAVGTGHRLLRSRYDEYAFQRDLIWAQKLAPLFAEWTREAVRAAENGTVPPTPIFTPIPPKAFDDGFRPRRPPVGEVLNRMRGGRHDGKEHDFGVRDRLLLTDAQGQILLNTSRFQDHHLRSMDDTRQGIAVRDGGEVVGYLYFGRMVPGALDSDDDSFFHYAGIETWVVTVLTFLVATALGLLLTWHIVGPVKQLNNATRDVESGILDIRLPDRRRDEMGDLVRSFNAMAASLQTADLQRKRLIADSAHELRTPVSLIRTRIEMMEEGVYPLDGKGLAALAKETDRLVGLIEELKVLANLESDDAPLVKTTLEILELTRLVIDGAEPAIERLGLKVEIEPGNRKKGIWVAGDRNKLHRLLRNLLSNALRYAERRIVVRITAPKITDDGPFLTILVEDDGPGISHDERERVFERYYRIDASRNRASGGSGLGLAICRSIVRAHGGSIVAGASQNLGGAAITVQLPLE